MFNKFLTTNTILLIITALMNKKIFKLLVVTLILFITYRAFQMWQWSKDKRPTKDGGEPKIAVQIRKLHAIDDTLIHPIEYTAPLLNGNFTTYRTNDTIYLKYIDKQLVEFEIAGDSNTRFDSINLIVWDDGHQSEIKPHLNKRADSYLISGHKIFFAFKPWVHTSDLNELVFARINYNTNGVDYEKDIPIKVLHSQSYDNFISNRLALKERLKWKEVKLKYEKRLTNAWDTGKIGNGRKSYYHTSISPKLFFAGQKYKSGKYTNEYVALDGNYKVTLFVDYSPSIIVEPLNVML